MITVLCFDISYQRVEGIRKRRLMTLEYGHKTAFNTSKGKALNRERLRTILQQPLSRGLTRDQLPKEHLWMIKERSTKNSTSL